MRGGIMINQDMIIFKQCGYEAPNGKNTWFDSDSGEIHSTARYLALRELNKVGIKVLQMEIEKFTNIGEGVTVIGEWWLIEEK